MNKLLSIALFFTLLSVFSCGNKSKKDSSFLDSIKMIPPKVEGDATIYGLTGDGCSDSTLVYISFEGTDPVSYNIVDAVKKKKVIGRLETGDWIAVVVNPDDSTKADMVINLDQLKGEWVYKAMPRLIKNALNESSQIEQEVMDSMIKAAMIPNEQGFAILRNNVAEPIGKKISLDPDEIVLVEYPDIKPYTEWRIFNGLLLLTEAPMIPKGAKKGTKPVEKIDTIEFMFLIRDSLQLKYKDEIRDYYRRSE